MVENKQMRWEPSGVNTPGLGSAVLHGEAPPQVPTDGQKMVSLILASQTWVHRRVDAFRLDKEGGTRSEILFDVTVPKELRLTRPGGKVAVPLAFLSKSPLPRLTTADAAGKALCVLEAPVNSYYALEFLTAMVPPWVRSQPASRVCRRRKCPQEIGDFPLWPQHANFGTDTEAVAPQCGQGPCTSLRRGSDGTGCLPIDGQKFGQPIHFHG